MPRQIRLRRRLFRVSSLVLVQIRTLKLLKRMHGRWTDGAEDSEVSCTPRSCALGRRDKFSGDRRIQGGPDCGKQYGEQPVFPDDCSHYQIHCNRSAANWETTSAAPGAGTTGAD